MATGSKSKRPPVSVVTNLGTLLVVMPSWTDTVGDVRATIKAFHNALFPRCGDVDVTSLEVEMSTGRNQLHDSLIMGPLLEDGQRVLYVQVTSMSSSIHPDVPILDLIGASESMAVPKLVLQHPDKCQTPSPPGPYGQGEKLEKREPGQKQELAGGAGDPCDWNLGCALTEPSNFGNTAAVLDPVTRGMLGRVGSRNLDVADRHMRKKKRKVEGQPDGILVGQNQAANLSASEEFVEAMIRKSWIGRGHLVPGMVQEECGMGISKPTVKDMIAKCSQAVELRRVSQGSDRSGGSGQAGHPIVDKVPEEPCVLDSKVADKDLVAGSLQAVEVRPRTTVCDDSESSSLSAHPVKGYAGKEPCMLSSKPANKLLAKSSLSVKSSHEPGSFDGFGRRSQSAHSIDEKVRKERGMSTSKDVLVKSSLVAELTRKSSSTDGFGSRIQSAHPVTEKVLKEPGLLSLKDAPVNGLLDVELTHKSSSTDSASRSHPSHHKKLHKEHGSQTGALQERNTDEEQAHITETLGATQCSTKNQSHRLQKLKVPFKSCSSENRGSRFKRYRYEAQPYSCTTSGGTTPESSGQSEDLRGNSPTELQKKHDNSTNGKNLNSSPKDVSKPYRPGRSSAGNGSDQEISEVTPRRMKSSLLTDGGKGARRNRLMSSGGLVNLKYKHFIDSQDGFDELITLSQQKLNVCPQHKQELKPVDVRHDSRAPVLRADASLSTDIVLDTQVDVGYQYVLKNLTNEEPLEGKIKETNCSRIDGLGPSNFAVQKEFAVVEPLKYGDEDGKDLNSRLHALNSMNNEDTGELVCVKPDSISAVRSIIGKEPQKAMSDDSQQIQAAVQLARMSRADDGDKNGPEKSPIKKRKIRKQRLPCLEDHVLLNLKDSIVSTALNEKELQDVPQQETKEHLDSSVRDLSIILCHEAGGQGLETNYPSAPNLKLEVSLEHENPLPEILMEETGALPVEPNMLQCKEQHNEPADKEKPRLHTLHGQVGMKRAKNGRVGNVRGSESRSKLIDGNDSAKCLKSLVQDIEVGYLGSDAGSGKVRSKESRDEELREDSPLVIEELRELPSFQQNDDVLFRKSDSVKQRHRRKVLLVESTNNHCRVTRVGIKDCAAQLDRKGDDPTLMHQEVNLVSDKNHLQVDDKVKEDVEGEEDPFPTAEKPNNFDQDEEATTRSLRAVPHVNVNLGRRGGQKVSNAPKRVRDPQTTEVKDPEANLISLIEGKPAIDNCVVTLEKFSLESEQGVYPQILTQEPRFLDGHESARSKEGEETKAPSPNEKKIKKKHQGLKTPKKQRKLDSGKEMEALGITALTDDHLVFSRLSRELETLTDRTEKKKLKEKKNLVLKPSLDNNSRQGAHAQRSESAKYESGHLGQEDETTTTLSPGIVGIVSVKHSNSRKRKMRPGELKGDGSESELQLCGGLDKEVGGDSQDKAAGSTPVELKKSKKGVMHSTSKPRK